MDKFFMDLFAQNDQLEVQKSPTSFPCWRPGCRYDTVLVKGSL